MKKAGIILMIFLLAGLVFTSTSVNAGDKKTIKAIYIPLGDHYAGIVAYEKYRAQMKKADYSIERMKSWPLLRALFMSGEVDIAFIISPMAMDMFSEKPNFRWISLMHRDGNALAINDMLNADVKLPEKRIDRKPDNKVAKAFADAKKKNNKPVEVGVASLLATHTVILYKYLKDNGMTLALGFGTDKDVVAIEVPPAKSPAFIKQQNSRGIPSAIEQSLPWVDIIEIGGYGHIAWYSKDVLKWPNGHVECIAIATDDAIKNKKEALKEVIYYIHKAGNDIEKAKHGGREKILPIADMIRRHIPEHNREAIVQSLREDLNAVSYSKLNVDKKGLGQVMDLAVEAGMLKNKIDIDTFTDESFSTEIND